jgi:AcrR family transcriptional regulator
VSELDPAQIARAALAICDSKGPQGLTMRAVAESLKVTPMSLYHHVADKAALVSLIADAALAEEPLPAPTGEGWQQDALEFARWMRRSILLHPITAFLRRELAGWTPTTAGVAERWLSIWQQSGLPFGASVLAAQMTANAIVGSLDQEVIAAAAKPPPSSLLDMYPSVRASESLRLTADADANFDLLAEAIISGMHERLRERESVDAHNAP